MENKLEINDSGQINFDFQMETSTAVENTHNHQDEKRKCEETPQEAKQLCKRSSIVMDKSEVDILKCCLCNKFFCSPSALETHIQAIHCTIKVKDNSVSKSQTIKNRPGKLKKSKQIVVKKLKICNKLPITLKSSDSKHISIPQSNHSKNINNLSLNEDDNCIKIEPDIVIGENSSSQDTITQNIDMKDKPIQTDICDLLVPKVEIEISETEFRDVIEDSNTVSTDVQDSNLDKESDTNKQNSNSDDEDSGDRLGYKCPFCNYTTTFRNAIQKHMRVINVDHYEITNNYPLTGTYLCPICNTKFSSQPIYDLHVKTHSKSTCETCKFVCFYECELTRHQYAKYHNIDCYQCYICSEYFNTSIILKEHFKRSHTNIEFKYRCQICTGTFDTKTTMYKHSQIEFTHSKDMHLDARIFRPYKLNCNPCDKNNFTINDSSLIQIGNKKSNIYNCKSCKYRFSSIYYLNQHFLSQHINIASENNQSNENDSPIVNQILNLDEQDSAIFATKNSQHENIIIPTYISSGSSEVSNQPNCTIEPEIIVPDILDHETIIPDLQPDSIPIQKNVTSEAPKLLKKQSKFKSIQLKVNNTSSQICSVNMQNNTPKSSDEVDLTLNCFFEKKKCEEINSSTCTTSDPLIHYKKKSDKSWCNFCQCYVSSHNHAAHSDSTKVMLNCQKCTFQSFSLAILRKHFKKRHLPLRRKMRKKYITLPDGTVEYVPHWTQRKAYKIKYYSTPESFANPCLSLDLFDGKSTDVNNCKKYNFFCCPLCNCTYDKYEKYTDHFSIHCILPLFKCIICKTQFDHCSDFLTHIKEHSESKIHCDFCYNDFQINSYFNEHDCKPSSKCTLCPSEIESNFIDNLNHTQQHIVTSICMYKCVSCNFYFYTRYNLDKHLVNKH